MLTAARSATFRPARRRNTRLRRPSAYSGARVGKHFGGEHITVQNLAGLRYRKHLIAMAPGKTADVARRFAVTTRWVRAVRNAGAADPRQIEMFVDPDPGDGTGSV